jgi:superfamily II DNA or RNA helicase
VSAGIALRPYQAEAIKAVEARWESHPGQRTAVVLPTGTGKTVMFAHLLARSAHRGRGLVLVHRDELIRQAVSKIRTVAPELSVGVIKAQENDLDSDVIVASVQTLSRPARLEALCADPRPVDLGVVDECHHATAASYRKILNRFSEARWVGVTATLARGDGVRLSDVWDHVAYRADVLTMIRSGWLADVRGIAVRVEDLDLESLKHRAGDIDPHDLARALHESQAVTAAVKAYAEHCPGHPAILFAPTVASAHEFGEAFTASGYRSAVVSGETDADERRAMIRDFEAGRIDVLCNCMVLTEGFDSPRASTVIIARATESAPLYVQMVGRVLRPFPGKRQALVLDLVGASRAHALATLSTLSGARPITLRPGQSFIEAALEDEATSEQRLAELLRQYESLMTSEDVDLFHGSRQRWLQTRAGYWFIPAGDRFIALLPSDDDGYDVASFGKSRGGGWIAQGVPDLTLGMATGEADITPEEMVLSRKAAQWRKRKASQQAVEYAARLKMDVPENPRSGEVSDLISIGLASARIDRAMARA